MILMRVLECIFHSTEFIYHIDNSIIEAMAALESEVKLTREELEWNPHLTGLETLFESGTRFIRAPFSNIGPF